MYITGSPYDTLLEVIGVNGNGIESLKEHGVTYKEVALKDGMIDVETVLNTISETNESYCYSTFKRVWTTTFNYSR